MRPVRLRIENFTCFRDPVELDFEGLNLFAITGPTGAGKSSLLDAMIFALYGKVPRMGGKGLAELISLGRDRMGVVFDFTIGERHLRIARTVRRKSGAAQVQLDEVGAGGDLPVCSGVRETEEKIKELVGLAYEAFTQAVVLPQGEFAHFLKSPPGEQRKILRDLLRLLVYERMRDIAARERDRLKTILGQLEERLGKDYAGATNQALESRRQRERELSNALKELADELKAEDEKLNILRRRRDQTRELEQQQSLLAQLAKKEPATQESQARIDAARRAAPVLPLVDTAERTRQQARKAETDAKAAKREHDEQRSTVHGLKSTLEGASRDAEKLPILRKQIGSLDQVLGQTKSRDSFAKRLLQTRKNIQSLKSDLDTARKQQKNSADELSRRESALDKANKDLTSVGYDPELDHALDEVRNDSTALSAVRETANTKSAEADAATDRAKREKESAARAAEGTRKAAERLEATSERLARAQTARDAAHQQHAAAILRRQLRTGEPCPVCDQQVTKRPAQAPLPHLEALDEKLNKAKSDEAVARKAAEDASGASATAEATAKEADRLYEKALRDLDKERKKLESAERQLDTKIGTLVARETGKTIEARVLNAVARITELRRRHQSSAGERDKAKKARDQAQSALEKAQAAAEKANALISQAENEAKNLQDEIDRVNSEIAKVTNAADPKAEREKLIGICTDLEDALKKAREQCTAAENQLSAADAKAAAADKATSQAVHDAEAAQKKAHEAISQKGFTDEAAVKKADLSIVEIGRLEREVRDWTRNRDAAAKRQEELLDKLGTERISQQALKEEEDAQSNRKKKHAEALAEHARCAQEIRQLDEAVKRATEIQKEIKVRQADFTLYAQLADDLRSERFQAFLLDEVFRDLVRGASERLWNLTEVYRLEWRDGAFYVVDHDNARQLRSTDTLSGGETFLASLALALELSEQVQRASGAVPLDSLFIDEGFGTLDRETLDDAAAAIERLPKNGRTVGIITHLEELSARLPARVRVTKQAEGSRVATELG